MTTNAALNITADEYDFPTDKVRGGDVETASYISGLDRVQVSFPAEDGYEPTCKHCGEVIYEDGVGWVTGQNGSYICTSHPDYDDPMEVSAPHEPETGPGTWCNSASVSVDEEDDAVHVSISVGDPRGAFVMTVRKVDRSGYCKHCGDGVGGHGFMALNKGNGLDVDHDFEPDGERYMLHVPYEGMGFEHMPLRKLSEGTFLVG